MKMKVFISVVLLSISLVNCQVFSKGKCPEVKVQDSLDLEEYMGKWYEIYKFPASFEAKQRCNTAMYTLKANRHINVTNYGFGTDGSDVEAQGDGYVPDESEPAKLAIKFSQAAPYGKYWVLDTDYNTYTLIYSCSDIIGLSHFEFAWILAREKTISDELKNKLFEELESFNVKTSNFEQSDQKDCNL